MMMMMFRINYIFYPTLNKFFIFFIISVIIVVPFPNLFSGPPDTQTFMDL